VQIRRKGEMSSKRKKTTMNALQDTEKASEKQKKKKKTKKKKAKKARSSCLQLERKHSERSNGLLPADIILYGKFETTF